MHLQRKFILKNVTVIDGSGGAARPGSYCAVAEGNIRGIGPMGELPRWAGTGQIEGFQEIDLPGHYIMPGLIDAHVHLAGGRGDFLYGETEVLAEPKLVRAMRSVYEAQKLLKRGFTSVRDISWNGLYLKRIFGEGILPGPRIIACGPGLNRTGGHADLFQYTEDYVKEQHFWGVLADGPDECRKWVRRILREGADQIKFWASGGDNWAHDRNTDVHYTIEEMRAICEEAHMVEGTLVCCHAENRKAIRMALDAGADTIEHGEDLDEELASRMAAEGKILVPTLGLLVNWFTEMMATGEEASDIIRPEVFLHRTADDQADEAYQQSVVDNIIRSFNLARERGVKIALGSDTVYEPLTEYGEFSIRELGTLVSLGMSLPEAIRAATAVSAEALGMSHRLGTLEKGKAADILVLTGNPYDGVKIISDPGNIRLIISHGRLAAEEGRFAF